MVLAMWQVRHVWEAGGWPLTALVISVLADVAVCYRLARPVPGLGILLPGFAAAVIAIATSWLLLSGPAELPYRPLVAYVAGVVGPLVGADSGETGGEWRFRRRSVGGGGFFSLLFDA